MNQPEHHYIRDEQDTPFEIQPGAVVGLRYKDDAGPVRFKGKARVRTGSVIYADCTFGHNFQTGHNAVIRERVHTGDHIVIGTNTVLEGDIEIADFVKIESNCFIPTHVRIGPRVFIGPGVTLTNDRFPLKMRNDYTPDGPILEGGVTLGAGVVIVPGVRIGEGSFVAAGAVVTKDIPAMSLVSGVPGRVSTLPDHLREMNTALNWRGLVNEG